ncbi:hypothetical protein N7516_005543 [Penicillium verrucosum]|uniref:uncharacterized protein n=1 Tax=Penicillium verrucosum TaxID=60171 RepID=UPI002545361D|nr:uncharacterized protein N7516_005543 [Penicillium verrucosum]KAJ5945375.1 hypothetical protein N7516_005543 [Penicillium verrucosum]
MVAADEHLIETKLESENFIGNEIAFSVSSSNNQRRTDNTIRIKMAHNYTGASGDDGAGGCKGGGGQPKGK